MKIRHSIISYLIPGAFLIASILVALGQDMKSENGQNILLGCLIVGFIALSTCIQTRAEYLAFDQNTVYGATGVLKKKRMTIPLSSVTACQLENKGFTNVICVQSASGTFNYKNMAHAKRFVRALNNEIGSIQRNADTVHAIKEGFASLRK